MWAGRRRTLRVKRSTGDSVSDVVDDVRLVDTSINRTFNRLLCDAGEKQYKFEEILPIYKQVSAEAEAGTFADFMEAFKTFDREGQGFINAAEMRHVLTSLGLPVSVSCQEFYLLMNDVSDMMCCHLLFLLVVCCEAGL